MTASPRAWHVSGSYFEVCSCEAVCPCRRQAGTPGGRSTYGECDFGLSWHIRQGHADTVDLSGLSVVLAGAYSDDEGKIWRVALYVDERADPQQRDALTSIFLGRAGGTTLRNFAKAIGEVYAVRTARIQLDHTPNRESMRAGDFVVARTDRPVVTGAPVPCGIPGHDRPGQEIVAQTFRVSDAPLQWDVTGRCGFASSFDYRSDG
jgi:hypothetical protein